MKTEFATRKQEMKDFLLEHIIAQQDSLCHDKDVLAFKSNKENIALYTITSPKQFEDLIGADYDYDSDIIDNDRAQLKDLYSSLLDFVVRQNNIFVVPGFVFLQSNTDFGNTGYDRDQQQINHRGFNKQVPTAQFNDTRYLDPVEIATWTLYQNAYGAQNNSHYIKGKGEYVKELMHYNPNEKTFDLNYYKHIKSPRSFARTTRCVVCNQPAQVGSHEACKRDSKYIPYLISRREARYQKNNFIRTRSKKDLAFTTIPIDKGHLEKYSSIKLHRDVYKIATLDVADVQSQ